MESPLLEVDDLTIHYETADGSVAAVNDASFSIDHGEYFGLVGESGCGKSTTARSLIGGLDDNGTIVSGTIRWKGEEIQDYSEKELNESIRWKEMSWIPQGSMSSLDPLERVVDQAVEIAGIHTDLDTEAAREQFAELFEIVGLQRSRISDYPHQFSGGMQQRALIALALFLNPELVIADEPTTALDVIMQDQVFKYLGEIKGQTDMSLLLITHDISVIFESCDRMAVMHGGQTVEDGPVTAVYDDPRHPYAILLQEAFPDIRYPDQDLETIEGNPPQLSGEVDYCTFADRCPWAVKECREAAPDSVSVGDDHLASCIRADETPDLYAEHTGSSRGGER
jgi:oligopeptide/dipeptide ABC transporter ATP-binding protein